MDWKYLFWMQKHKEKTFFKNSIYQHFEFIVQNPLINIYHSKTLNASWNIPMKFDIIWSKSHIYIKLDLAAHYLIARGFFNVENFWMLFTHLGLNFQIRIVIKYIFISKLSSLHETNLNINYYQHNIWYFTIVIQWNYT